MWGYHYRASDALTRSRRTAYLLLNWVQRNQDRTSRALSWGWKELLWWVQGNDMSLNMCAGMCVMANTPVNAGWCISIVHVMWCLFGNMLYWMIVFDLFFMETSQISRFLQRLIRKGRGVTHCVFVLIHGSVSAVISL